MQIEPSTGYVALNSLQGDKLPGMVPFPVR
jgi:hypothetical protein